VQARLRVEKDRKAPLAAELGARRGPVAQFDGRRLLEELRARGRDVRGLLGQDIPRTRGYRFAGQGTYVPLLLAAPSTPEVVTPGGVRRTLGVRAEGEAVA
jgi:hypothetical protein